MFGVFRQSMITYGGLLWKRTWRMSRPQKYRLRKRMQQVDANIEALYEGLRSKGLQLKLVEKLKFEMPKEAEMNPKDKYTVFNKSSIGYRKSVHLVPKWTKKSFRTNPEFF